MSSDEMERRLIEAAQKGKIDELNGLIGSNALVLEETALKGAGHTPLHIACVAGHLDFARELLKLMPRFAEKVNADGLSPLHIAAARGDVEIARELLSMGQHLCYVKGWDRRIPLHYAVVNGEVDVMKLLLSASPASIEETTAREETALHLAVKNNRFEVLVVLVEHLKQHEKEQVINLKDHEGNTALHLAAATKNFEVVDFMLRGNALESGVVEVNASNESGLTPLDISTLSRKGAGDREITEILRRAGAVNARGRPNSPDSGPVSVDGNDIEGANTHQSDGEPVTNAPQSFSRLRSRNLIKEKESLGDVRNALLVVAALIASATYQAVLQPPNFTPKVINDYPKGFLGSFGSFMTSPLRRDIVYIIFVSGNTLGLFVSVQMIICLTRDLPVKLPLMLSLSAMVLTYLCYMSYLPYASMDRHFRLMNVDLLAALPLIIVVLLLLTQRWLARGMEHFFEKLSRFNLLGGMYNLKT